MTKELLKEIRQMSDVLVSNGLLQSERGNKAAGLRARKASLMLERLTKAFRKASLEEMTYLIFMRRESYWK